ncbi:MAG: NADH-quinone oxidoreductase subunit L [Actinobacteria bacterium]|nr:NADH-quinone oxidoreductase subunit L [Actinomycetota bacterium]MBI3686848.1 NADH-quinone oxidoreductase subunit L [Actinomycetota bacterium]
MWLLLALPFGGAAVLLLGGRRADRWGHYLGTTTVLASFLLGLGYFLQLRGERAPGVQLHLFTWIPVNGFTVDAGLLFDRLSACFVLLITGVGGLIHVYAMGYMAHDPGRRRFFGYFNLFVGAMLLLVLGNNYLSLYVGWEGVGLASYLLIAFWYHKPSAATAAKKAFVVNRVGDVGLSLAIMLMFVSLGTTSFDGVFAGAAALSPGLLLAISLLLLLGAAGKSGQFPLQTWLPDAMEGPTPVSALIHAATMVTAGVYLIARSSPLYDLSPGGRTAVTVVGAITLLYGAISGTASDDIKRVLAFSTVSQIGYMFLAVGLGPAAYAFGILHLLAHGFFKAGLFLGAGSVMHGMRDEVDMRKFGGLARHMPVTFATFGLGYLALIGFPGLSGFFSKDKIIEAAFDKGGTSGLLLGASALLGAGLTAFYMTRLMFMTFFGDRRWEEGVHPHESPRVMTVPMVLLAVGSLGAGGFLAMGDRLVGWLEPVVGFAEPAAPTVDAGVLTLATVLVMLTGVGVAWVFFGRRAVPEVAPVRVSVVTRAARASLYADAFNEAVFMRPGQWLVRLLVWLDNRGVDGVVNGLAAAFGGGSGRLRRLQTGFVRSYALSMLGGAVLIVGAFLMVRFA